MQLTIETPEWAEPLLYPARYKAVHGGRGSGKSHFLAELLVEEHVNNPNQRSICVRSVQKSIKMSVKSLIEQKIEKLGVGHLFDVKENGIYNRNGEGLIIFQGMQNHTADSVKSLEGFDRAWWEEAQTAAQGPLDLLRPTIRAPGSQIWFSWNPESEDAPIEQLFRAGEAPPDSVVVEANFSDNPWFPEELRAEMEYDKGRDFDKYHWIWLGGFKKSSEAQVFRNWTVEEFDPPSDALFRFGADWGFSVDPTVLVRCFIVGKKLYVDYEAYRVGCDIMDTPDLFMSVPESERWPCIADSARPETISHMNKNGFPKITPAVKGPGSLEEGVTWLQNYDIIVHPRCKNVISELKLYKYKTDPLTDKVLPVLEDKNNHCIDALRYACESARRAKKRKSKPLGSRLGGIV